MKGGIGTLIYAINWVVAVLLLLSLVVPYVPPARFYNVSLVSLVVAPLLLANVLFLVYWLLLHFKRSWLSFVVLVLGYLQFGSVVGFSGGSDQRSHRNQLQLSSFNVRLFNAYEPQRDSAQVEEVMAGLIDRSPDLLLLQEFYRDQSLDFSSFPYRFEHFRGKQKLGHAIFSRYPILQSNAFDFEDSGNNTIYCDIDVSGQRIRIYNVHLQSMGILPKMDYLQEGDSDKLRHQLARAFIRQEQQLQEIMQHASRSPYPVILAGDFNNTPFSYVYRELNKKYQDAFDRRGSGLGTTFWFEFVPLRIDYIFCSDAFDVVGFITHGDSFSDHKPISATLGWPPIP